MQRKAKYDRESYNLAGLPVDHIDRLTLERIPRGKHVLELGCATGYMTEYMSQTLGCSVVGVDMDSEATVHAAKFADTLIEGDLNKKQTWNKIHAEGLFDVVLASNVIEHLVDTQLQLQHIRQALSHSGKFVMVVPNICWWRSRLRLLQGKWAYEQYGLFDETHLRFFSLPSLRQELSKAGFHIRDEAYDPAGGAKWLTPLLRQFPNAYAYQVVVVAEKINV